MTRRALVIDDDTDLRELIGFLLAQRGFEVETLTDGIHAVELPKVYDVIVLDMKMPVFDGERLTDYWLLTNPDILRRVIVLSGYSRAARRADLPVFATLAKPFDYDEFLAVVEECAANRG